MATKFERCKEKVNKKIKQGKIPKSFKCDAKGKPNKLGEKRCKTNAFAICQKLK